PLRCWSILSRSGGQRPRVLGDAEEPHAEVGVADSIGAVGEPCTRSLERSARAGLVTGGTQAFGVDKPDAGLALLDAAERLEERARLGRCRERLGSAAERKPRLRGDREGEGAVRCVGFSGGERLTLRPSCVASLEENDRQVRAAHLLDAVIARRVRL